MNKKVIIIGAFHEIIELAEDNRFEIIGLVDSIKKNYYRGYKIIGTDADAKNFDKSYPLIITPDSPYIRLKLVEYYLSLGFKFTKLISRYGKISKSAEINNGVIAQSGVNVSSECIIEKFVKLNTCCNIMHNSFIGQFTTIAPNAVILGGVKVRSNCYIGSNSTILPYIEIMDNSIVGAGSVVTKDVPPFTIVAGNPAKVLKRFNNAEELNSHFRLKRNEE